MNIINISKKEKIRKIINCLAIVFLIACELYFMRNIIFSQNNALIGDRGDARLGMLTTEHWWNFFCGKEGFAELAMYHPSKTVIGFTDLFFGYGLIHSIFRVIGIDMFTSYKLTLLIIHFFGTLSMYYLLKKKIKCNIQWSLFGTVSFSFSSSFMLHLNHNQLDSLALMPLLIILFIGFIKNFNNRKKRNIYAYLTIATFALIAYTSWYIACFTGFFVLVGLIIFLIILIKRKLTNDIMVIIKQNCIDFICYIAFVLVLFIPFIMIYIPSLLENGGYSYSQATEGMVRIYELINVPTDNMMMGWIHNVFPNYFSKNFELIEGFSIVLLTTFVVMMFFTVKDKNKDNKYIEILNRTIFIAIVVCIILTIKVRGYTLWIFVYYLLPVMKGIRVVPRFLLYLSFPMALITSYTCNRYIKFKNKKLNSFVPIIFLVLVFISNINLNGVRSKWCIENEKSFINRIDAPPKDAEVFFIAYKPSAIFKNYEYQLDAFEIANHFSIKTLNGYSGQCPAGSGDISNVFSPNYNKKAFDLIRKNNLHNVYVYDYDNNSWISSSTYFNNIK